MEGSGRNTIAAPATAAGRSGIGVIRLSGGASLDIARSLAGDEHAGFEPRHATLVTLLDLETREPIDEALVTYFKAPHSFTGEDVVEISCHGSPVLLRQVLDACLKLGARMAEPGEFSLRALGNGRIDLTEAEAIRDLIDAQTATAARHAVRQLRGAFSAELAPIKDDLLNAIVILESALEFVEDDLPAMQAAVVRTSLLGVRDRLDGMAATYSGGRLLREGLSVSLAGRPNVGKSSLFNALLGQDRAIVTDIPGTTRDHINERFEADGVAVTLLDTAGLRETDDVVESIGVDRSRRAMADSDIVVLVVDGSDGFTAEDREILDSVRELPRIVAINKLDKIDRRAAEALADEIAGLAGIRREEIVAVSAKEGTAVDDLASAIVRHFRPDDTRDGFLVTDARHYDLLTRARDEIDGSLEAFDARMSEEIVLVGLHNAMRYLGRITGETTTEDMLSRIFSTFCIGK